MAAARLERRDEGGRVGGSSSDGGRFATVHWGGLGRPGPSALGRGRQVVRCGFEVVGEEGQRRLLAEARLFGWVGCHCRSHSQGAFWSRKFAREVGLTVVKSSLLEPHASSRVESVSRRQ